MKYITSVSMEMTLHQFNTDLKNTLLDMPYGVGPFYEMSNGNIKAGTVSRGSSNMVCSVNMNWPKKDNWHHIEGYNPKLFLALAAMTEGEHLVKGEYLLCLEDTANFKKGEFIKVKEYNSNDPSKGCFGEGYSKKHYRKATKDELVAHFTQKGDIVAYRLKVLNMRPVVAKLLDDYISFNSAEYDNLTLQVAIHVNSLIVLSELGVIEDWFEPIYGESKKVVTVSCSGKNFNVEVSAKGIYYEPEDIWFTVEELEDIIEPKNMTVGRYEVTQIVDRVSIGCKLGVSVQSIKRIIKTYKELKQ